MKIFGWNFNKEVNFWSNNFRVVSQCLFNKETKEVKTPDENGNLTLLEGTWEIATVQFTLLGIKGYANSFRVYCDNIRI